MEMKMSLPKLNSVYSYRGEECLVAHVDENQVRLEGFRFNAQYKMSPSGFQDQLASGELKLIEEVSFDPKVAATLSMTKAQKARFSRRCDYVRVFYERFGPNLPRDGFEEFSYEVAERMGDRNPPAYTTLLGWCKDYWASGRSELALMEKIGHQRKRTKRLTPEVENILRTSVEDVYLKEERLSESLAYRIFCGRLTEYNALMGKHNALKKPCFNTFRARLQDLDPFRRIAQRQGPWVAKKMNRRGEPLHFEERIGARVEVDSNRVDVLVRNEEFGITYRPELTILLDVATRCVIGWDLSMRVASAAKTLSALKDAVVRDDFYPARAVPELLVVDNGKEFANQSLEHVCGTFCIELRRVAPRSPNEKAFVERAFKTFNDGFFHTLEGTKKSNPSHLGDYDAEEASIFTLKDLQNLFRQYLTEVYHHQVHSSLGGTPAQRWEELSKEMPPRTLPKEQVEQLCLVRKDCSIHQGRVKAFGLLWKGPGLPMLKEKHGAYRTPPKAILMINPDRIGQAWVGSTDKNITPQPVTSTLPTRYHDKSLAEMKLILDEQKMSRGRTDSEDIQSLDAAVSRLSREISRVAKERKGKQGEKRKAKTFIRAKAKSETRALQEVLGKELIPANASVLSDQDITEDNLANSPNVSMGNAPKQILWEEADQEDMETIEIKPREGQIK